MKRTRGLLFFGCALLATACGATPTAQPVDGTPLNPTTVPTVETPPEPQPREMSQEDCAAKGGTLVGDIGDGAIHRPEYRCPSGSPPIGRVALGIEGSVCCM